MELEQERIAKNEVMVVKRYMMGTGSSMTCTVGVHINPRFHIILIHKRD